MKWPKNGDTVDLQKIVEPLCSSLCELYKLEQYKKEATYKGLGFELPLTVTCNQPSYSLSKMGLK